MASTITFLFILGCPHSGTTILHRLVGGHPQVHAIPGESGLFARPAKPQQRERTLARWAEEARDVGKSWVAEKTPWHVLHIDEIRERVPGARFMCVVRDPLDVYGSLKKRGATRRIPDTLEGRTALIVGTYELLAREAERSPLILLEDLAHAPERSLNRAFEQVGLDAGPEVLSTILDEPGGVAGSRPPGTAPEGQADGAEHRALREWQMSQPLFTDTRNRDEVAEAERRFLLEAAAPAVDLLGGHVDLRRWGEWVAREGVAQGLDSSD